MRSTFILALVAVLGLSSCASYNVTVYNDDGSVKAEHVTDRMYVGTDSFVLDAIIDPFVMLYSLFIPTPSMSTSVGVSGGVTLAAYLSNLVSLAPVPFLGGGSGGANRVLFHADDGHRQHQRRVLSATRWCRMCS